MLLLWSVALLLLIPLIYRFYNHIKVIKQVLKLPGPKRHPLFGNAFDLIVDLGTLNETLIKWAKTYKSAYLVFVYPNYAINVIDPYEIEKLISTMKHSSKSVFYDILHKWLGEGLLTSKGNKWQVHRKLLTSAFHFNILQQFVGVFKKETDKLILELDDLLRNVDEIDIVNLISQFTLYSINETSMGTTLEETDSSDKEYKNAILGISDALTYRHLRAWLRNDLIYYNLSSVGRNERKLLNVLHKFSSNIIKNRRRANETITDNSYSKRKRLAMLDLLITAENEHLIDGKAIEDEINTFMFEGHDTTAMSICFTLMLLAAHKSVQEEIFQEINEIFPHEDEEVTITKLNEFKYLERCIKESLRLYPSVPFISRTLDNDFITNDNRLWPKGSSVNIMIYDLHRTAKIYPNPDKFDPDRFLPENVQNRHPFAYIPFSAGPRNCIGQKFAMLEMKTVLIGIIRRYILEPVDTPKTIILCRELVLRSKNGIRVKFIKRH